MEILQTILSIILLSIAAYVAAMNWTCLIMSIRTQRRGVNKSYSQVFLFQNILSVGAFLIYPHSPKWWIWLIPAMDLSNITLAAWPFVALFKKLSSQNQ